MLLPLIFVVIGSILFLPLLYVIPLHLTKKGIFIIWFGALMFTLFSFVTLEAFPIWQAGILVVVLMLAVSYLLEGRLSSQLFRSPTEHEASIEIEGPLPLKKKQEPEDEDLFRAERTAVEEKEPKGAPVKVEEDVLETFSSPDSSSWENEESLKKAELSVNETNENEMNEEDIDMEFLHKRLKRTDFPAERHEQKEEGSDTLTASIYPHYMSEIDELLFDEHPERVSEHAPEKPLRIKETLQKKEEEAMKRSSRYTDYFDEKLEDVWGEDDIIDIKRKREEQE